MFDQITPALVAMIVAVIAAVGGYLAAQTHILKGGIVTRVNESVPPEWHWALNEGARMAVKAAYQLGGANHDKFANAAKFLYAYLDKSKFKFTEADKALIQAAIEAAWVQVKHEIESDTLYRASMQKGIEG